jgi:N-acetylneuraminic acid mutarotase
MFYTDSKVYIVGGFGDNGILNDVWEYSITSNKWREVITTGEEPPPFLSMSYTQYDMNGERYFVVGGLVKDERLSNDIY